MVLLFLLQIGEADEPNNYNNEDFGELDTTGSDIGTWNDENNRSRKAIVERCDQIPQPVETPTLIPVNTATPTSTHLSTPVEFPSPIQRHTFTPTPTPTLTSKPTATITPSQVSVPTSTSNVSNNLIPYAVYEFDHPTLNANGWAEIPGGFINAQPGLVIPIGFLGNPIPSSQDQTGLQITVKPNEVATIYLTEAIHTQGLPILLRMNARANASQASIALVALKGDLTSDQVDGSIATNIPSTTANMIDEERQLVLIYEPDTGEMITPLIQVAATGLTENVTAFVDRLEVFHLKNDKEYLGKEFSIYPVQPASKTSPLSPRVIEFDQPTLAECGWIEIPGGFLEASGGFITPMGFIGDPIPSSVDKKGLSLTVRSNDVAFVYAAETIETDGVPVLLRITLRSQGTHASVALAALKGELNDGNVDGSIAMIIPANAMSFIEQEKQLVLLYEPDSGETITPVIQVASSSTSESVTIYVDRLEIIHLYPSMSYRGSLFASTFQELIIEYPTPTYLAKPTFTPTSTPTLAHSPTPAIYGTPIEEGEPSVQVLISPIKAHVLTGENVTFDANVIGIDNNNVVWDVVKSAGGGSITSSGVYTAPDTTGVFQIIATSSVNTDWWAIAEIVVHPSGDIIAQDTIGPSGGIVGGGGLRMEAPAGALSESQEVVISSIPPKNHMDDFRISEVYGVDGLPETLSKPLTIEIALNPDQPIDGDIYVVVEEYQFIKSLGTYDYVPRMIQGQLNASGTSVTAVLLATDDDNTHAGKIMHGTTDWKPTVSLMTQKDPTRKYLYSNSGFSNVSTTNNKIKLLYPTNLQNYNLTQTDINNVVQYLQTAYDAIEKLGFSWTLRKNWPIKCELYPFTGSSAPDGLSVSTWKHKNDYLLINSNVLNQGTMNSTIGHELFHLMQGLYQREYFSDPNDWLWMDEALSTWFESRMSSNPNYVANTQVTNQWFLIQNGLEVKDKTKAQAHGYGASAFLDYLSSQSNIGTSVFANMYKTLDSKNQNWNLSTTEYRPVQAFQDHTSSDIGLLWRRFVRAYFSNSVYANRFATSDLFSNASLDTKLNKPDIELELDWNAPELGAFILRLDTNRYAGADNRPLAFIMNELGPYGNLPTQSASMILFEDQGGTLNYVDYSQKLLFITNPQKLIASKRIFLVLANGYVYSTGHPDTTNPIKVTITNRSLLEIGPKKLEVFSGDPMQVLYVNLKYDLGTDEDIEWKILGSAKGSIDEYGKYTPPTDRHGIDVIRARHKSYSSIVDDATVYISHYDDPNDLINLIDPYGKKQGIWEEASGYSSTRRKYMYQDQATYMNGVKNGEFKSFYNTSPYNVRVEGEYKDGKRTGHWIFYNNRYTTELHKQREGDYANDIKIGEWIFYKSDGDIHSIGEFNPEPELNIHKHGEWKYYSGPNDDLVITSIGEYDTGNKNGEWNNYYYPSGHLSSVVNWDSTIVDPEFGRHTLNEGNDYWDDPSVTYYDFKQDVYTTYYDLPGNPIKTKGEFKNGLETGSWTHYYEDGQTIRSNGSMEKGEKTGTWRYFYNNGNIEIKSEYQTDGIYTTYYIRDNKEVKDREGLILHGGLLHGHWIWYRYDWDSGNTNIWKEGDYDHGSEVPGTWKIYDDDGAVVLDW